MVGARSSPFSGGGTSRWRAFEGVRDISFLFFYSKYLSSYSSCNMILIHISYVERSFL